MIGILQAKCSGLHTVPETIMAKESLMSAASMDECAQYVEEVLHCALEGKKAFNGQVQVCLLLWSRIDSYYRSADGLRQEQLKNWMTGQVTKRIHNARAQRNRQPKPKQTSVATQT